MKEALLDSLQVQMDKCTNEQFWAVASLTAADGFFITQRKDLAAVPHWVCMTLLTISMLYGARFIIHRHIAYYRLYNERAKLLQGEPDAPAFMKETANTRRFEALSGVTFYVGWVVAGYALCWYTA